MSAPSSQRPSGVAKGERLATGDVSWEMREGGGGRLGRRRGTSGVSDGMLGPVALVTTGGRAGGVGGEPLPPRSAFWRRRFRFPASSIEIPASCRASARWLQAEDRGPGDSPPVPWGWVRLPPPLRQQLLVCHRLGQCRRQEKRIPQSEGALAPLLHRLDWETPARPLAGTLLPRMQELACPWDPALMGGPGWLPARLGPCQGRHMLQDADVGHVCVRARRRSPTAAELAHAKSMQGMPR